GIGTAGHRGARWSLGIVSTAAGVSIALLVTMWTVGIYHPPASRVLPIVVIIVSYAAMFLTSRMGLFQRAPFAFVVVGPLVFLGTLLAGFLCADRLFHLPEVLYRSSH